MNKEEILNLLTQLSDKFGSMKLSSFQGELPQDNVNNSNDYRLVVIKHLQGLKKMAENELANVKNQLTDMSFINDRINAVAANPRAFDGLTSVEEIQNRKQEVAELLVNLNAKEEAYEHAGVVLRASTLLSDAEYNEAARVYNEAKEEYNAALYEYNESQSALSAVLAKVDMLTKSAMDDDKAKMPQREERINELQKLVDYYGEAIKYVVYDFSGKCQEIYDSLNNNVISPEEAIEKVKELQQQANSLNEYTSAKEAENISTAEYYAERIEYLKNKINNPVSSSSPISDEYYQMRNQEVSTKIVAAQANVDKYAKDLQDLDNIIKETEAKKNALYNELLSPNVNEEQILHNIDLLDKELADWNEYKKDVETNYYIPARSELISLQEKANGLLEYRRFDSMTAVNEKDKEELARLEKEYAKISVINSLELNGLFEAIVNNNSAPVIETPVAETSAPVVGNPEPVTQGNPQVQQRNPFEFTQDELNTLQSVFGGAFNGNGQATNPVAPESETPIVSNSEVVKEVPNSNGQSDEKLDETPKIETPVVPIPAVVTSNAAATVPTTSTPELVEVPANLKGINPAGKKKFKVVNERKNENEKLNKKRKSKNYVKKIATTIGILLGVAIIAAGAIKHNPFKKEQAQQQIEYAIERNVDLDKSIDEQVADITKGLNDGSIDKYMQDSNASDVKENTDENVVVKKSNEEIADEVMDGKWGNGEERKQRLTEAGYDYSEIQSIVNDLVKQKEASNPKNDTTKSDVNNNDAVSSADNNINPNGGNTNETTPVGETNPNGDIVTYSNPNAGDGEIVEISQTQPSWGDDDWGEFTVDSGTNSNNQTGDTNSTDSQAINTDDQGSKTDDEGVQPGGTSSQTDSNSSTSGSENSDDGFHIEGDNTIDPNSIEVEEDGPSTLNVPVANTDGEAIGSEVFDTTPAIQQDQTGVNKVVVQNGDSYSYTGQDGNNYGIENGNIKVEGDHAIEDPNAMTLTEDQNGNVNFEAEGVERNKELTPEELAKIAEQLRANYLSDLENQETETMGHTR